MDRTYRYPIPGDHIFVAVVECPSGIVDSNVKFYAPPGFSHTALFAVAPGTRLVSLADHGPVPRTYRYRGTDARGDGHYGTWRGTVASLESQVNKWYRAGWRDLTVVTGEGPVPPGTDEEATVAGIGRRPGERTRHCWYEAP